MKKMKLQDCCIFISDGDHQAPPKSDKGVPFITISNITTDNRIDFSNVMYVPLEYYEQLSEKSKAIKNDILYSVVGSFGKPVLIEEDRKFVFQRHIAILRPNLEKVIPEFLYYTLLNPQFYTVADYLAIGAAQRTISLESLRNIEIELPSLSQQKRIVDVIAPIDKKMHENAMINDYLEEMAKTIYDYWFVQFDFPDENGNPYKSSGGKMDLIKDFGIAPSSWKIGNLYDIAEFINGLACQKYRPTENEDSLPVIKIKEMHDGISSDTEQVKSTIPENNIVRTGDILFSWSASIEIQRWTGITGGLNQHIFKVIPKEKYSSSYVYHQLKSYVIKFIQMAETRKTTMGHITSDHLKQSVIILPPENIIRNFSSQVDNIHAEICRINKESQELSQLRDWLLLMLMNGQATIED